MDIEHVADIINKSARTVAHQMRVVEKLKAEGADTTETEHLLAYFATAHTNFENFLQRTISEQEQRREEGCLTKEGPRGSRSLLRSTRRRHSRKECRAHT